MKTLDRLGGAYRFIALTVFTSFLLFVLVNLLAYLGLQVKEHIKAVLAEVNPVYEKYGEATYRVYPGMSRDEINDLLVETWTRTYTYEPYTQFREGPFSGAYVNVDEAGFRWSKDQGPWPPAQDAYNVFVFGGSTTFGYGLPDDQTVPSALQERLGRGLGRPVRVYNFGRGHYTSTLERVLFQTLLSAGHVPDAAIFIDGLNDFAHPTDDLRYTSRLAAAVDAGLATRLAWAADSLPVMRVLDWIGAQLGDGAAEEAAPAAAPQSGDEAAEAAQALERVVERYYRNQHMIQALAKAFGVPTVFVWHPIAAYEYDSRAHLFTRDMGADPFPARGYLYMRETLRHRPVGANFIWCADIQKGVEEPLYVDAVHYSAAMAERVADCITAAIVERGLLP